jgi:hypothetical protein
MIADTVSNSRSPEEKRRNRDLCSEGARASGVIALPCRFNSSPSIGEDADAGLNPAEAGGEAQRFCHEQSLLR